MQISPHRDVDMWGRVLTLIKNISLVLRLSLCNFRDLIYSRSACNSPKRKKNFASYELFKQQMKVTEGVNQA